MPILEQKHRRAAWLIVLLAVGIVIALAPYASGLIAIPVFFVLFEPAHQWLAKRFKPGLAAGGVVVLGILTILVPGAWFIGLVVSEAQGIAAGVMHSPLLDRLRELRVGQFDVGAQIATQGQRVVAFIGSSAFALLGTATRAMLNLAIAFFGLFFLLTARGNVWESIRPHIPFSAQNADKLAKRFRDVTMATVIGTGLTAGFQGLLVGMAFWVVGLPNALFWGVVTGIMSIFPVLGSGLVWAPGAIALALQKNYPAAVGLLVFGLVVVGNVDNVVRPAVFRRWAQVHPFITLLGAFAGVRFFGILGLLIGPLALSYFFELLRMYSEEYASEIDAA